MNSMHQASSAILASSFVICRAKRSSLLS